MKKFLWAALAALMLTCVPAFAQVNSYSMQGGGRLASAYGFWRGSIITGNTATGSQTITVAPAQIALPDGRVIQPWNVTAPITVDLSNGSNVETVTPTAVSCNQSGGVQMGGTCSITASFNNTHGAGIANIQSGTFGLQEAINDAFQAGGGQVIVDRTWGGGGQLSLASFTSPANTSVSTTPYISVSITDTRFGATQYWNMGPSTTSAIAVPSPLTAQAACDSTHTFCSDSTVAGSASWGGTVHGCVAYVDAAGNEGVCSTDVSFTSVASKAIDIGAPAASSGAVGYKPYLSLSGGSYALAYSLPLLTQPSAIGAVPLSSGVCTLTTIETTTPACALSNATYGQSSSNVVFTSYPVVTNTLNPNLDSASAQSLNPNFSAVTTYKYIPSNRVGIPGVVTAPMSFPITTAAQSTVGQVAGTIPLPPGFMNYAGREIQVCGLLMKTSTTADTISNVQAWWDSEGSNVTTGQPIQLNNIQVTATLTAAPSWSFCFNLQTTVASASATGGTIVPGNGWMTESQVAAGTIHTGVANSTFAAVGSLNLALNQRIDIVYNHTTGTDGSGVTLINPTVTLLN